MRVIWKFLLSISVAVVAIVALASTVRAETAAISGTLLPHVDGLLGDLEVSACPEEGECVAGEIDSQTGEFRIEVARGSYYVTFTSERRQTGWYAMNVVGKFTNDIRRRSLVHVRDFERSGYRIRIPRSITISVSNPDGSPHPSSVRVCTAEGSWLRPDCSRSIRTSSGDQVHLTAPRGDHFVYVWTRRYGYRLYYDVEHGLNRGAANVTMFDRKSRHDDPYQLVVPDPAETMPFEFTVELEPGANLVGWAGGRLPASELFAQAEPLVAAVWLDAGGNPIAGATRDRGYTSSDELLSAWLDAASSDPIGGSIVPVGDVSDQPLGGSFGSVVGPDAGEPDVRLELRTGSDLLGWTGDARAAAELFAQEPSIAAADWLDAAGNPILDPLQTSGDDSSELPEVLVDAEGNPVEGMIEDVEETENELPDTRFGSLLWLWSDADEAVTVVFRTRPLPHYVEVPEGSSYTVWGGAESIEIERIARALGTSRAPATVKLLNEAEADAEDAAVLVQPGDILQVELAREMNWLQPLGEPYLYHAIGRKAETFGSYFTEHVEEVIDYFWNRYEIAAYAANFWYSESWDRDTEMELGAGAFRRGDSELWFSYMPSLVKFGDGDHVIAQVYFYLLEGRMSRTSRVASWLVHGSAIYEEWQYSNRSGRYDKVLAQARESIMRGIRDDSVALRDTEGSENRRYQYLLGPLAVEWLVNNQGGTEAMIDFWKILHSEWNWHSAFQEAFGISTNDFYAAFAEYRTNGFE